MVAKTALIGRKRDCEVTAGYRAKAKKNPPSEENQNLSLSLSLSLSIHRHRSPLLLDLSVLRSVETTW